MSWWRLSFLPSSQALAPNSMSSARVSAEEENFMKAVVTVVGKDRVGTIAKVSALFSENDVNILDISQTIMQDMFCMIMLVQFEKGNENIGAVSEKLSQLGTEMGLSIHVQREEIFNSMHRI